MAHMTPAQLQTLKTYILSQPDLLALPNSSDGNAEVAQLLNQGSTPANTAVGWKSAVKWDDVMGTAMDWARVDNLSVGKARIWEWMFANTARTINAGAVNIRTGIDTVWVGTAADLAVRAAVYGVCKRTLTRGERIYATGTGSDAVPATVIYEGSIHPQDVESARNLP